MRYPLQNPFRSLVAAFVFALAAHGHAQQWSSPTAIGNHELRAVQRHRDGTEHVITRSASGFATPQLWHSWRPAGGAWRSAVVVSLLGDPAFPAELPLFDGQQLFQLDDLGRAHLVFSKFWSGERRLWHTVFDPRPGQQTWSAPFPVTPLGGAPTACGMRFDRTGALHLLWTAIPGMGAAQLFHSSRPVGGTWSAAVLLSTPGSPMQGAVACRHPASSFLIEAGGGMHVFFEQVPAAGGVAEVFHRRLPVGPAAPTWSQPAQISSSGQPATAVATGVDGAGGLHVFWRAIPGLGAPQVWHARCPAGAPVWSAATILSTPGTPNMGAQVHFARNSIAVDAGGDVHVVFDQVPGIGARQVFARTYELGLGTWSPAIDVTPPGPVHTFEALLIDRQDTVHVLSMSGGQLFHSMQSGNGPFGQPTLISSPGAPGFGADLPYGRDRTAMHVAPDGTIHVLFEQVPAAFGPSRIWHTSHPIAANAVWTTPVDVSGALNSAARIYETHCDERSELHVVFGATASVGAREQLFHARADRFGAWMPPAIVSTVGNPTYQARIPLVPWLVTWLDPQMAGIDYDFLGDNRSGSVDLVYTQRPSFQGAETVYHATLDRFALSVTTTAPGIGDLSVRLVDVPVGTVEGFVFLSLDTSGPLGGGWFLGLAPDALTPASFGMPALPGNPMHWTFPAQAPLFPAAPFGLPPGSMPLPLGTKVDFVAVAVGPGGGWTRSNVRRVEF